MRTSQQIPQWIQKCPRPWVVADWGVLRALKLGSGLPGTFTALLPDQVLVEAAGSKEPHRSISKLEEILCHPVSRGRFLIGRYWDDIARAETVPKRVSSGSQAAVHVLYSTQLRQSQNRPRIFVAPEDRPAYSELGDRKEEFVALLNDYARWMEQERPEVLRDLRRGGPEHRLRSIRDTQAMARLAIVTSSQRYGTQAWRRMLGQFPDQCAIGRWLRIVFWYGIRRATAPDENEERFANNSDDAHYVFLSLYTRHMWTADKGMKEAVDAVSGGAVRVHADVSTIPSYSNGG